MAATGELIRMMNYVDDIAATLRRITASLYLMTDEEKQAPRRVHAQVRSQLHRGGGTAGKGSVASGRNPHHRRHRRRHHGPWHCACGRARRLSHHPRRHSPNRAAQGRNRNPRQPRQSRRTRQGHRQMTRTRHSHGWSMPASVEQAAREADLVIEAVPEEMESKIEIFTLLDKVCRPTTILASNTSSLSITEIAIGHLSRAEVRGHALLQSGAQDEAAGDRARARDRRRDARGCGRSRQAHGQRSGRDQGIARIYHQPHQCHDRQRSVLHAAGGRCFSARTSTRR